MLHVKSPKRVIFPNLLGIVCLTFVLSYAFMVFFPPGANDASNNGGVNFYLSAGFSPHPGRRAGFLAFGLLLLLLSLFWGKSNWRFALKQESSLSRWFLTIALTCLFFAEVVYRQQFWWCLLAGFGIAAIICVRPQVLKAGATHAVFAFIFASMLAIDFYLLFFTTPNFFRFEKWPNAIVEFETHTAVTISSPADRMTKGLKLFDQVGCSYGFNFPVLLALGQKVFGFVSWGSIIKFIGAVHVLFIIGASCAYIRYAERHKQIGCLASAMLAPYLVMVGSHVFFPQISAIRYFGFLIAIVYLLFVARNYTASRLGFSAGFVSSICMLSNLETGICVSLGLGLYVLLRNATKFFPTFSQSCQSLCSYLIGLVSALLGFEILVFACFGYLIPPHSWAERVSFTLGIAGSGSTSSGEYTFFVLPVVIAVHCGYVLVITLGKGKDRARPENAVRAAIAAMNLAWLMYFFNRPVEEYVTANYFLYLFFVIDLLKAFTRRRLFSRQRWLKIALCSLCFVVATEWFVSNARYFSDVSAEVEQGKPILATRVVSGIIFPLEFADELEIRAACIKKYSNHSEKLCYITFNPVLMTRLSGVRPDIPLDDVYFWPRLFIQNIQFVDRLFQRRVDTVLVDAPGLKLAGGFQSQFCLETYRLLLKKYYKLESTKDGWQIWVLREIEPPAKPN
jgi:hypothetical protein